MNEAAKAIIISTVAVTIANNPSRPRNLRCAARLIFSQRLLGRGSTGLAASILFKSKCGAGGTGGSMFVSKLVLFFSSFGIIIVRVQNVFE